MTSWNIANSPVVVTLISVLIGSSVAAGIAEHWRRQTLKTTHRFETAREIVRLYHDYVRLLRSGRTKPIDDDEWSQVHSKLLAEGKVADFLFAQNGGLAEEFKHLGKMMADVRQKLGAGKKEEADELLDRIFDEFARMLRRMFDEVQ